MANISYVYLINPTFQFMNVSGKPLVDGYVNVYISGTRSKYYAFSDFDGTLHPFNIPLNALGSAVILVSPAHSYDIYVYNSVGTLQMSRYNITPATGEGTVITDVTTLTSKDGTVDITANSSTEYDLSIATKIAELKEYTDQAKNDAIESANTSIADIDNKKKDKQTELNFNGSATKTVKKITQNANGELNVEFADIDLPQQEVPNVEITSEDSSVNITTSVDAETNTKTFDLSVDSITNIASSDGSINVSSTDGNVNLTLPSDVVRDSAYTHIDAATSNPLMDGIASAGVSTKYAREDHVHPSDTSREDIANKTTVVLGTSDSKYPTDKAVAEFVNSSIATNTANYISNNGEPFTSVEQLEAYSGPVTNNDYAFVTGTDSEGNTYYDRYKATVSGETVTWALEYRLNNSSFTAAQWSAINSGITSALVTKIHTHSNKDVLDGITSSDVTNWNSKQNSLTAGDNITIDGSTISSNQVFVATYGKTKYAEVKAAYDAGKICTVFKDTRYFYISEINPERIKFVVPTPDPNIYSLTLTKADQWTTYNPWLQLHLTFDTEPKAGSKNPVTSDGIKTAIGAVNDDVVDLSQSVGDVKDNLNNLAATVGSNTTQIGQLQTDVESIESSLTNKKDRQPELNFAGSATKTVKSITQDANGVINVEYENIDFVRGDSNVEIKSEDNSVNVVESTDSQTNTKTYDLSVADSIKSKIKDITITNDTLVIIGD